MKAPFVVFAVFALVAAAGGFLIPASGHYRGEAIGLALLVLGLLGATVLPFLTYLVKRDAKRQ